MSETPISPLRRRMIEDMSLRNFGEKTQNDYIRHVKTFSTFLGHSPAGATGEDLRRYQVHQSRAGESPATINASVAALRFFFRVTLNHPEMGRHLTLVPLPERLRVVLSEEEVAQLLEAAPGVKYKAAFSVAYGAGLRVSEVANLKVTDVHSKRMLLRVEQGKGRKDRHAMLSPRLLAILRDYWWGGEAEHVVVPRARSLVAHHHAPASSGPLRDRRSPRDQQARDTARPSTFVCNSPARPRRGHPRDPSFARNIDILPANSKSRLGSGIRFIRDAERWCLFSGDSPTVASISS